MRTPSSIALAALAALAVFAACTAPDKLVSGQCGDGVINPGEDCEYYSGEPYPCGMPGSANECRYICNTADPSAQQCKPGYACEDDSAGSGVCVATPDACGNGIVDPGEDCEVGYAGSGTCGAPGTPNGCHFVCSAQVACPPGAGCGSDGRCRDAGGSGAFGPFDEATGSPFPAQPGAFRVTDFTGDGQLDLVSATFSGLVVNVGAGDGTFPASQTLPVTMFESAIGDFTGNHRQDVAFEGINGAIEYDISKPGSGFAQVLFPYPFELFTDGQAGAPDLWIPMRPDATQPFDELLHIEFEGSQLRLGFDELLVQDPSPVVIPSSAVNGGNLFGWPTIAAPAFPIADAIVAPASGGDELALGLSGDVVVRIYTAKCSASPCQVDADDTVSLVEDTEIALPGPLLAPPLFADIDGDGHLDVVAIAEDATGAEQAFVALGTGDGFGAAQPDAALAAAFCFPTAAANLTAASPAELFCDGGVFALQNGAYTQVSPATDVELFEGVFVDINRDGVPDLVAATTLGLEIYYGNPDGLFSSAFVSTQGQPANLRVGDFDGDQIPDVAFVEAPGQSPTVYVLYGSTGALAAPIAIDTLAATNSIEPAVLGTDQGFTASATSDLVTDTVDPSTGSADFNILFGDSSRTMDDLGFFIVAAGSVATGEELPETMLAGRFTAGATADQVLVPIQDATNGVDELLVFQLPVDGALAPTNAAPAVAAQVSVAAFANGTFDITQTVDEFDTCQDALFVAGDLDGDGVAEVVGVQGLALGSDGNCDALASPSLLTLSATASSATNAPIAIATSGLDVSAIKLADFDGDGYLDLLIDYAGDPTFCDSGSATFPCTNTGNELQVVWGGSNGLTAQTTEVPVVAGTGAQQDAVPLRIDASATPELLVTTNTGLYAYDLQADRSYAPRAAPILGYEVGSDVTIEILGFQTSLATGDVNDDGLQDLLLDDGGTMHVLVSVPAAQTVP